MQFLRNELCEINITILLQGRLLDAIRLHFRKSFIDLKKVISNKTDQMISILASKVVDDSRLDFFPHV